MAVFLTDPRRANIAARLILEIAQLTYLGRAALKILLLPPGLFFVLIAMGLVGMSRAPGYKGDRVWFKNGRRMVVCSVIAMYVCSTGLFANAVAQFAEIGVAPLALLPDGTIDSQGAQAIVILAGGQRNNALENPRQVAPSWRTLERLAYGARLAKQTGLPILVTGGTLMGQTYSEASAMDAALISDFGLQAKWVEERSLTTAENAQFSAKLLAASQVKRILLVTHAGHMIRSVDSFNRAGLEVVAAPTAFARETRMPILAMLPNAHGMGVTFDALHELIGIQWYRLSGAGGK